MGEIRYARSGGAHIAYRIDGTGAVDLVRVPGVVSHVELNWEPTAPEAALLVELSRFTRLVTLDKRGTGLSDRLDRAASAEERMDDLRAVMDAVGLERAAIHGISEGGAMAILFAATYPERVSSLVLTGTFARYLRADDYPWGLPEWVADVAERRVAENWGTGAFHSSAFLARESTEAELAFAARYERNTASPGTALDTMRMNRLIDVRHALPLVHAPTLVMHARNDRAILFGNGRYLAEHLPNARFVPLERAGHLVASPQDAQEEAAHIREFLTGAPPVPAFDRVLATILFTDIVDSTDRAARAGDGKWRAQLDRYLSAAAQEVDRFGGRLVKDTGDGLLATFDGPARAVHCASALERAGREAALQTRAGLHTGEVERSGDDVRGIAVHIAARVAALAGPGEVLVSRTVRDLTAGSGIAYEARGAHALKGLPEEWELYAVG